MILKGGRPCSSYVASTQFKFHPRFKQLHLTSHFLTCCCYLRATETLKITAEEQHRKHLFSSVQIIVSVSEEGRQLDG